MIQTQVSIMVDRDVYRQFKAGCILRGTTPTRLINAYVKRQVEEWESTGFKRVELAHEASCAYWEGADTPCTCEKRLEV
jgi:hypothetical protein